MEKAKSSDLTRPFIPQQIVEQSGGETRFFYSTFGIKGKSNIIPSNDLIEKHRILNQEGLLIIEDETKTMLIKGIFTKNMPLNRCLKEYLEKHILGQPFTDLDGQNRYITPPTINDVKIIQQDHLSPQELEHTSKQFNLTIVKPLQYEKIIKKRMEYNDKQMEYNNKKSNDETGEC